MFDTLSESTQLILSIIGLALLCVIVLWNNKRNRRPRNRRNFKASYTEKTKQRKEKDTNH